MGLETGVTHIDDLNASNPTYNDSLGQADDHIRNIKTALLNTFPNLGNPATATASEFNRLVGQDQEVATTDSPTFVTVTLSDVALGNVPRMSSGGFTDSPISVDSSQVMIGSGTPSEKLHVNGNIKLSGDVIKPWTIATGVTNQIVSGMRAVAKNNTAIVTFQMPESPSDGDNFMIQTTDDVTTYPVTLEQATSGDNIARVNSDYVLDQVEALFVFVFITGYGWTKSS